MTKRLLAWTLLGLMAHGTLQASEDLIAASAFAFPSVEQAASARAIALGSTYVGIAEGSAALMWNPAGLAGLTRPEISLHHNSAILDAIQEYAILGLPLGCGNALALSLNYEDNGVFEGRDANGAVTSDYSARAYGVGLGWGVALGGDISVGLGAKFNNRDLAGTSTGAFAGDLGILWSPSPLFTLGAAYTNIGLEVQSRQLAQAVRVGVSSMIDKGTDTQWLFALSGESLTNGEQSVHLGAELTLYKFLALRGGYGSNVPNPVAENLLGWTFGGGIILEDIAIDYAYVPLSDLGNMQRLSLTYAFGKTCSAPPVATPVPTAQPTPVPTAEPTPVPVTKAQVTPVAITSETYVVKKGDTLWDISGKKKMRDDNFQWPLLYDGNKNQIVNPDQIEPNQVLQYEKKYPQAEVKAAQETAHDTAPYTAKPQPVPVIIYPTPIVIE